MSFFDKLKAGLAKTRDSLVEQLNKITGNYVEIDEDMLEELEKLLLVSDVGLKVTQRLLDDLRRSARMGKIQGPGEVTGFLAEQIAAILSDGLTHLTIQAKPTVILTVGVNGVGKTTTIGKLGNYYGEAGYKVMFAAADTFRAAAAEQLEIWGQRAGAAVIRHKEGADPAAVVFDALQAARARGVDVLLIDTAGRLHNKINLMEELKKIYRVIQREIPEAPHATLLVLDATTGQNAINQAQVFIETAQVTGIVLTKLDGTAKGGAVVGIKDALGLPVQWIGVGEGTEDLRPFEPFEFSKALFNK